jgi:hypothetical protein
MIEKERGRGWISQWEEKDQQWNASRIQRGLQEGCLGEVIPAYYAYMNFFQRGGDEAVSGKKWWWESKWEEEVCRVWRKCERNWEEQCWEEACERRRVKESMWEEAWKWQCVRARGECVEWESMRVWENERRERERRVGEENYGNEVEGVARKDKK